MKYKFLKHTADVKFQAFGSSLEEAFSNAALALKEVMTKGIKVNSKIKKKIKVSGRDYSSLLYNFLEEFLYIYDTSGLVISTVERIEIKDGKLEATVCGEKIKISNDVKAVTYNEMKVEEKEKKFLVQVVLDV